MDTVSCLISETVEPESDIASTNVLSIVMFIIELLYLTAATVIIFVVA